MEKKQGQLWRILCTMQAVIGASCICSSFQWIWSRQRRVIVLSEDDLLESNSSSLRKAEQGCTPQKAHVHKHLRTKDET
eukprot:1144653-Pelagomonas_calceolata.AAC.4